MEAKFLPITSQRTLNLCKNPPEFVGDTVFICSYPKSGTTWTQNIVYEIIGLQHEVNLGHISLFAPFYENDGTWENQSERVLEVYSRTHTKVGIRVFNTHLPWEMLPKGSNFKYIYLFRDGRDVVCSFYHHLSNQVEGGFQGSFREFLRQWLSGKLAYGTWADHLRSFCAAEDAAAVDAELRGRLLLLRYEDMLTDLMVAVNRVARFLHVQLSEAGIKKILPRLTFASMQKNLDRFQPLSVSWRPGFCFIRKGQAGSFSDLFGRQELEMYLEGVDPGPFLQLCHAVAEAMEEGVKDEEVMKVGEGEVVIFGKDEVVKNCNDGAMKNVEVVGKRIDYVAHIFIFILAGMVCIIWSYYLSSGVLAALVLLLLPLLYLRLANIIGVEHSRTHLLTR